MYTHNLLYANHIRTGINTFWWSGNSDGIFVEKIKEEILLTDDVDECDSLLRLQRLSHIAGGAFFISRYVREHFPLALISAETCTNPEKKARLLINLFRKACMETTTCEETTT